MLVSKAEDERGKLVTKSDEAFALLLIDNYIDKCKDALTDEVEAGTDKVTGGDQSNNNNKIKTAHRKVNGNQKWALQVWWVEP